jgi:hypothetical protein
MCHLRMFLLSIVIIITYCLIATLFNWDAAKGDISKAILLAVLVFLWCMGRHPNRKYFS